MLVVKDKELKLKFGIIDMKKVRPFSNGTEFEQWDEENCSICPNSIFYSNHSNDIECHIDNAFSEALFGYGEVNKNIVDLIGFDNRHFLKECPFKNFKLIPVEINTSVLKELRLKL